VDWKSIDFLRSSGAQRLVTAAFFFFPLGSPRWTNVDLGTGNFGPSTTTCRHWLRNVILDRRDRGPGHDCDLMELFDWRPFGAAAPRLEGFCIPGGVSDRSHDRSTERFGIERVARTRSHPEKRNKPRQRRGSAAPQTFVILSPTLNLRSARLLNRSLIPNSMVLSVTAGSKTRHSGPLIDNWAMFHPLGTITRHVQPDVAVPVRNTLVFVVMLRPNKHPGILPRPHYVNPGCQRGKTTPSPAAEAEMWKGPTKRKQAETDTASHAGVSSRQMEVATLTRSSRTD